METNLTKEQLERVDKVGKMYNLGCIRNQLQSALSRVQSAVKFAIDEDDFKRLENLEKLVEKQKDLFQKKIVI